MAALRSRGWVMLLRVGRIGADYHARFVADLARYGVAAVADLCEQTGGFGLVYDARGDRTLDVLGVAASIEVVPPVCARCSGNYYRPDPARNFVRADRARSRR